KKDFDVMLKYMDDFDSRRELLIKKSRDVLKLSKQIIYALHREDEKDAKNLVVNIKKEFAALVKLADKPELLGVGALRTAAQEYVEALCYFGYVVEAKLPTHRELKVSTEWYLLGICDLSGELVRKAINDAINGNQDSAFKIKKVVEEIYGQLLRFDFRDSNMRKSFDRIKYDLRRLEDVAIGIKLKNA
ncbi:hypothetical protein KY320_04350, partial [Candidatus Woesearchaeota archaeon]|nr:hypothetical protein [Candidatus Woesearchaeota archaeon]